MQIPDRLNENEITSVYTLINYGGKLKLKISQSTGLLFIMRNSVHRQRIYHEFSSCGRSDKVESRADGHIVLRLIVELNSYCGKYNTVSIVSRGGKQKILSIENEYFDWLAANYTGISAADPDLS